MFFLLFGIVNTFKYDEYGVQFNDDMTYLLSAPSELSDYSIPSSTVKIVSYDSTNRPFINCINLTSISFDNAINLEEIQGYSFYNSKLRVLNLSRCSKLYKIGIAAFSNSIYLHTIILNEGLVEINGFSFRSCCMSYIQFPASLKYINFDYGGSFSDCTKLSEVNFPINSSLLYLSHYTFYNTNISRLFLPKSLQTIFNPCICCPISEIVVDPLNPYLLSDNNIVYSFDRTCIYASGLVADEFYVPSSVTTINYGSFYCSKIRTFHLNEGLVTLSRYAFARCLMETIIIPSSMKYFGGCDFQSCPNLQNVIFLGENISTLGDNMFNGCYKLSSIFIPNGVKTISYNCFSNCISLSEISIPETVTTIQGAAFLNINSSALIHFRDNSTLNISRYVLYSNNMALASTYLGPSQGESVYIEEVCQILSVSLFENKNILTVIFPENSQLTNIESFAFQSSSIVNITLPSTLTRIHQYAFRLCTSLVSIITDNNINCIDKYAFNGCSKLSTFSISPLLQIIDIYCFAGCSSLKSISISEGSILSTLGEHCFEYSSIISFIIPQTVTSIGYFTFMNSKLENLTILADSLLDCIPPYSFSKAGYLVNVYIYGNIRSFHESCFSYCVNLVRLDIPSALVNISTLAFKDCFALKLINIPDDSQLDFIMGLAFNGCYNFSLINISNNHPRLSYEDGVLYNKDKTKIIVFIPTNSIHQFIIPSTITHIGPYSFQNCNSLEIVIIPDSVISIGYCAFDQCSGLHRLTLSKSLIEIGLFAFRGCSSLRCNSIVFNPLDFNFLIESGLSIESLNPCPTNNYEEIHTHYSKLIHIMIIFFLSVIYSK